MSRRSSSSWPSCRKVLLSCLMLLLLATTSESLPVLSNDVSVNEVQGNWSEWGEWIPCSRSCGAGVTTQNRTCLTGNCVGPSVQYMSCCIQECPSGHLDFREEQCQGSLVPAKKNNDGCSLICVSSSNDPQTTVTTLVTFVQNGTSCKTVEGYDGVCLGNMCAKVGCDQILGSNKIEDSCLQCHSPGSEPDHNCQRFAAVNTPNQAAMDGNLAIVIIPRGAATITISHPLLPGEGMLALKSSVGTYLYTSEMTDALEELAGAEFHRTIDSSGPHQKETLTTKGPISERITVELTGVHESAPTVEYEYFIVESPDTNGGMHNTNHSVDIVEPPMDPDSEYAWLYGSFSECSVSCGTGVKTATAMCRDLLHTDRVEIPDGLCRHLETPKPLPLLQKCNLQDCSPSWIPQEWSECSYKCGNGTQTRLLECHRFVEEGQATKQLPSSECDDSKRPEIEQVCNAEPCSAVWSPSPWTECPTQCGRWQQHRTVVCTNRMTGNTVDSALCDEAQKPPLEQTCVVPCDNVCYWFTSKFGKCNNACGYGTQNRRIRCRYIHNNHRANETCCENLTKPNAMQPCYDTRGSKCKPEWVTKPYGECQGDCCDVTTKEREVDCGAVKSSGTLVVFPDRECNETTKPPTSTVCVRSDCPRWRVSNWTQCDVTCGDGNQARDVNCIGSSGALLTYDRCECRQLQPPTIRSCTLPACTTKPAETTTDAIPEEECDEYVQSPSVCQPGQFVADVCAETCRKKFNS